METTVASLPLVELYLLAAAIRLHIRHCGGGTFAHVDPAVQKNGSRVIKSKKMMGFNVDQLLEETEKLTGIVRKKVSNLLWFQIYATDCHYFIVFLMCCTI